MKRKFKIIGIWLAGVVTLAVAVAVVTPIRASVVVGGALVYVAIELSSVALYERLRGRGGL